MATLHVRNVPDALYERLRLRARTHGRSINSEAIALLGPPLAEREGEPIPKAIRRAEVLRAGHRRSPQAPSVVEVLRQDHNR